MRTLSDILRSAEGKAGAAILALFAALALTAPWLFAGDPLAMDARPLLAPFTDTAHLLGHGPAGPRYRRRTRVGRPHHMSVAIASAATALFLGTAIGTIAGFGGWADDVLMRVSDAFQTVPAFLLAMALISATGPSIPAIVLAIRSAPGPPAGSPGPRSARARARFRCRRTCCRHASARHRLSRNPAKCADTGDLARRYHCGGGGADRGGPVLPGLGHPNHASWGAMVAEGRAMLRTAPSLSLIPGSYPGPGRAGDPPPRPRLCKGPAYQKMVA